jgi:hypothetical protein
MAYAQITVDQNTLPNTATWIETMTLEHAINSQNNKLQEFMSTLRLNFLTRQNSSIIESP